MIQIKTRMGFTLIEVLVTMAIIGLLSSIVLATISNQRNKARTANVLVQSSQIKTGFFSYEAINGTFPNPGNDSLYCISSTCTIMNSSSFTNLNTKLEQINTPSVTTFVQNNLGETISATVNGMQNQGIAYQCKQTADNSCEPWVWFPIFTENCPAGMLRIAGSGDTQSVCYGKIVSGSSNTGDIDGDGIIDSLDECPNDATNTCNDIVSCSTSNECQLGQRCIDAYTGSGYCTTTTIGDWCDLSYNNDCGILSDGTPLRCQIIDTNSSCQI